MTSDVVQTYQEYYLTFLKIQLVLLVRLKDIQYMNIVLLRLITSFYYILAYSR